jgi:hypothetical protein
VKFDHSPLAIIYLWQREAMPNGMFRLSRESQQSVRNRVLLVGLEPAIQDSISVVLNTMGWGCIAVSDLERYSLCSSRDPLRLLC